MSQNQPQSPKSRKSQVRPAKKGIFKRFTLQALRGMIHQLEGVVKKLEAEPADSPVQKSRSRRGRWSGLILGGAIATLAILLFRLTPGLFLGSTPLPPVSESSSITEPLPQPEEEEIVVEEAILAEEIVTVSETEAEEEEEIVMKEATPLEETLIKPEEEEEIVMEEATPLEEIVIESQSKSEGDKLPLILSTIEPPQPVEFVKPRNLEDSLQQDLIARIQDQIIPLTEQLEMKKIIQSIQPHFSARLLTIEVSDDWYTLTDPQQNEVAQLLFNQTQNLDFTRLKLYNRQGKEIARNAIIGTEMIILDRIQSSNY